MKSLSALELEAHASGSGFRISTTAFGDRDLWGNMMTQSSFVRRIVPQSKRPAYALTETVIALLILSIALLTMALVPLMTSKLALQTVQRERAMTLGYNGLELLEAKKYTDSVVSTDVFGEFTVIYSKPPSSNQATVNVSWSGITGASSLVFERRLSRVAYETRPKE